MEMITINDIQQKNSKEKQETDSSLTEEVAVPFGKSFFWRDLLFSFFSSVVTSSHWVREKRKAHLVISLFQNIKLRSLLDQPVRNKKRQKTKHR